MFGILMTCNYGLTGICLKTLTNQDPDKFHPQYKLKIMLSCYVISIKIR